MFLEHILTLALEAILAEGCLDIVSWDLSLSSIFFITVFSYFKFQPK